MNIAHNYSNFSLATGLNREQKTYMKFTKIWIGFVCAAIGFLMGGCASVPTSGQTSVPTGTIAYFSKKGQGPKGPTVVFQSGLGDGKSTWQKVIEGLPDSVSVFAYDRPGYGDSPKVAGPRDPGTICRELHEVLKAANVPPPYVLVGHSLGGLDMYCFAKLYPKEVVGLVLLDPTHPRHWARMQEAAPAQATLIRGLRAVAFGGAMRQEFDDQESGLDQIDMSVRLSIPVKFLFSGRFRVEELGGFEKMVKDLREQWLLLFVNAEHREVADSGHYLQTDASEAVVRAIQSAINHEKGTQRGLIR